ncbi:MAG: hypothetical protein H8E64_09505 [Candidatus Marinimicrobia bacterium]|nr:hypothetical protein [Candidatus Neomarinimicrobiota bacterium]
MYRLATIISYVFHPMFLSVGVFWILIFTSDIMYPYAVWNYLTVVLLLSVIPIITLGILKKNNVVSDWVVSDKIERLIPLRFGILYALIGFVILTRLNAEPLVRGLMFCFVTNTGVLLLITRYWKISIHAMSTAGLMVVLWLYGIHMPGLMLLILLVVSLARLKLNAHSVAQVTAGNILGLLLTYIQLRFFFM